MCSAFWRAGALWRVLARFPPWLTFLRPRRYYDVGRLQRDFGRITDYHPPKKEHPGSIMAVSNTGGHGRGGQSGRIIGDVINHGKHQFWGA